MRGSTAARLTLLPSRVRTSLLPYWERMRIIARNTLRSFWEAGHADAEQPLKAWFAEVSAADWGSMMDIKARHAHASVIDAERVVFNICSHRSETDPLRRSETDPPGAAQLYSWLTAAGQLVGSLLEPPGPV